MDSSDKILSLLIKIGKIDEADLPELKKQLGGLGDTGKAAGEKVGGLADEAKAGADKFKAFHGEGLEINKVIGDMAAQAGQPAFLDGIRAQQEILAGAAKAAQEYAAHLQAISAGEADIIGQLTAQLALQKAVNAARMEPAKSKSGLFAAKNKTPQSRPTEGEENRTADKTPKTSRREAAHQPATEDKAVHGNSKTAKAEKNADAPTAHQAGRQPAQNDLGDHENNSSAPPEATVTPQKVGEESSLAGQNTPGGHSDEDISLDQDWPAASDLRAALIGLTNAILANHSALNGPVATQPAPVTAKETTVLNERVGNIQSANTKAASSGHFDEAVHQLNASQAFGRQLAQAAKDAAKAHSESAGIILQALADLRASNQKLQEQINALQSSGIR